MNASSEAIREMANAIKVTIKNLQHCSEAIISANSGTLSWDDARAVKFKTNLKIASVAVSAPIDILQATLPKLEALAQAVDDYNRG